MIVRLFIFELGQSTTRKAKKKLEKREKEKKCEKNEKKAKVM